MTQDSILQGFVQLNALPIELVIYMIAMIILNRKYEPEITKKIRFPVVLLLLLILDDNVDYYFYQINETSIKHIIIAFIGYNLRINTMLSMIFVVLRNNHNKYKNYLVIPAAICLVLTSTALFTHWVIWYDIDGTKHHGILGYVPHIVSAFYTFYLVIMCIRTMKKEKFEEGLVILLACILISIGTLTESIFHVRGVLMGAISLIIVLYYLYVHNEYFKIDTLTGVYNRLSFRADTDLYKGQISGLFMIDLNDLKTLNDKYGHDEGDRALKTLAYNVNKILPPKCYLYRTGGDEFTILCTIKAPDLNYDELKKIIKKEAENTTYSWAVGYAKFNNPDEEFNLVYKRADKNMYEDKTLMKGGSNR